MPKRLKKGRGKNLARPKGQKKKIVLGEKTPRKQEKENWETNKSPAH